MEVRRCNGNVAQLLHFEDERVGIVLGVLEAALIAAFEQLDLLAAGRDPVILRYAEFLIHLSADGDPAVAADAPDRDELVEALLRLLAEHARVPLQKAVKRRRRQQHTLVSADGLPPVLDRHGLGFTGESFLEEWPISGDRAQLRFEGSVVRVPVCEGTDRRLYRLLF